MVYADLRADIENFTSNTDPSFLQSINRFINMTEGDIGQAIQIPNYVQTVPVTLAANSSLITVTAAGFIGVNDLSRVGYGLIEQKDTSFIREAYPDASETGPPRYFAMQTDTQLLIGPTADQAYTLALEFWGKWPSLVTLGSNSSTANNQTYISQFYESALLCGCLKYASMYMRDIQSYQMFDAQFKQSLGLVDKYGKSTAIEQKGETGNAANGAIV